MAYYLSKYVGTYRLMADIDQDTNDFPRGHEKNELEQIDVYIKCASGGKVYHYGRNKLVCYVPSLGRGHNMLKSLAVKLDLYTEEQMKGFTDYEELYSKLTQTGAILDVMENDSEVEWKFDDRNKDYFDIIMGLMKPSTAGCSTSPFSPKNLPMDKTYTIDTDQLQEYKDLVNRLDTNDKLQVHRLTTAFIAYVVQKKHKHTDVKKDMRKLGLKGKEYIHKKGLFKEYLKYLEKEINNILG